MLASEHSSWSARRGPPISGPLTPFRRTGPWVREDFSSGVCAWAAFHKTSCTYSLTM